MMVLVFINIPMDNFRRIYESCFVLCLFNPREKFIKSVEIIPVPTTSSSYIIPTNQMVTGQTYYWQVAKVCSTGQSAFSATKSFVAGGSTVTG